MKSTEHRSHVRKQLSAPQRVAIVRALSGLGDLLCVVPALRALRHGLPDARVTLVGLAGGRVLLDRFPELVDDFLAFPAFPAIPEGRVEGLPSLPSFLAQASVRRFDLALQMHGSGLESNGFTALLAAERTAGFFPAGHRCPDAGRFLLYPEDQPEVRRHLALVTHLGLPALGEELEFPLREGDRADLRSLDGARELRPGAYACLHPGASEPSRRWVPERFAQVADGLAERGLRVVLTGVGAEAGIAAAVRSKMRHPSVDLVGRTSLGALGVLLAGARIAVTNDTGTSHLAAAVRTPSVIVFTGSDPRRWAPLDRHRHCPLGDPPLTEVTTADVLAHADLLLERCEEGDVRA